MSDAGTATITDDDSGTVSLAPTTDGDEAGVNGVFTLTQSFESSTDTVLNYSVAGTASEGPDYGALTGTVTIPAGSTSATITIPVTDDALVEATETVEVTLTAVNSGGADITIDSLNNTASLNLSDNDTATFTLDDPTVNEAAGTLTFTISVDKAIDIPVDVDVSYTDVSAIGGGTDYDSAADTATFAAGSTAAQTVTVAVTDDTLVEATETFAAGISPATALGDRTVDMSDAGTGTITNDDIYGITIDDQTTAEGTNAVFTLTLTNVDPAWGVLGSPSVQYATAPGSAQSGADYTAASGTLTFDAATKTISVAVQSDSLIEMEENFFVDLSGPSANATIIDPDSRGECTIPLNQQASIIIDDITVDENVGNATFTVSLDGALAADVASDVTVQYATTDGTASGLDIDYTSKNDSVTISAGSTSATIDIPINDDSLIELAENFFVDLSNPSANATIGDLQGRCTINVDEKAAIAVADIVVEESVGNASFNVSLSAPAEDNITFEVTTADGSATDPEDYAGVPLLTPVTVTVAAGDTTGTFTVPVVDDALAELAETFVAKLGNPSPNATIPDSDAQCQILIDDNDKTVISIDNVIVNENAGTALFTVTLSGAATDNVTVEYATADGTATMAGGDYTPTSGTLTFVPGDLSETISVNIADDTLVEESEAFFVNLTNPSGQATIAAAPGQCTINVDDLADLSIDDATLAENGGSAVFTVTLSAEAQFDVTVEYQTADNTAVAGDDYTAASGTLTISAGSLTNTLSVPILNTVDYPLESDETFTVNLTNPTVTGIISISDAQGLGTITDNDHTLTITKAGSAADDNCTITVTAGTSSGAGGGTSPPPSPMIYAYDSLDTVTITAADTYPGAGSVFKGWTGDVTSTANSITLSMDADKEVTANFNQTYALNITLTGTGLDRGASVTASPGGDPRFPGGSAPDEFVYETGDIVTLTVTDTHPPNPGCEFLGWTVDAGNPGAGFAEDSKTNTVTMEDGDVALTGAFVGVYVIISEARDNGNITPLGTTLKYHGETQSYTPAPDPGYITADIVVDTISKGPGVDYTFENINADHSIVALFMTGDKPYEGPPAGDDQIYRASVPPLVLLVMGRNHKLYYEAYNDASDLNGDGTLEIRYNPDIEYYGYFDSHKVYRYDNISERFYPVRYTVDKKVNPAATDEWSGDYLNYLTMSRIDVLRKVLYGGYRSTDSPTETVLMRSYIPQDAHSWGKEYESIATDGYDIREYTPLGLPAPSTRHLFANTTLEDESTGGPDYDRPLLRVLNDSMYRIWEWVSIESPVAGDKCLDGDDGPDCEVDGSSQITDYAVKVVVCNSSLPETNSKKYPSDVYKPIGLLQRHGESGSMLFGLLSGSYEKSTAGGVLRKTIGPITDEINPNTGQFLTSVDGIIKTIDRFRIENFRYSDHAYDPGWPDAWVTTRPMGEGEFPDWGNPIAEMMYEGMRYFAGKKAYTPSFDYGSSSSTQDAQMGLPRVGTWDDPFETYDICAKAFMLVLTDINPTYDSDQLPGVNTNFASGFADTFSSADSPPVALDAESATDAVSTGEGGLGFHYIGQLHSNFDGSCTPKNLAGNGFGDVRGLCPEEPTKRGSYYAAGIAHFARTHDINPGDGEQNVLSYIVALASPLPRIEIPIGTETITLVPFAKSVGGCLGIYPDYGYYQPTNTIVDFYVQSLGPTSGTFRINYEDVEQAADHDMDAICIYEYQLLDNNDVPVAHPSQATKVSITLTSEYASGCIIQHMGYVISGTTADGTYLEVVDVDTGTDVDYFLDTPPGVNPGDPGDPWDDDQPLPLSATRVFTPGETTSATLLESPLWYAAKYGGFVSLDGNKTPNLDSEWDEDGDGVPDTYFYVVNPLKLEQQLNQTFADILARGVSHVAPVASADEANRTQSGDKLYMAFFKPMPENYWKGNLKKYGLSLETRSECGRTEPEWTLVDKNGDIAEDCEGIFKGSSVSYWSETADGDHVDQGGVGAILKNSMPGSDPLLVASSGPYYDFRNIYTYKDGGMTRFIHANISNDDLAVTGDLMRYRIINWIYGYTFDTASSVDSTPVAKREWILGDIIHSEPKTIDYIVPGGTDLECRFVAVGANDGMVHIFTNDDATIEGTSYVAGQEVFAFIPGDLLPKLQNIGDATTHTFFVDGPMTLHQSSSRPSGEYFPKTLVFGERRGGRSYWALDVTRPDPSTWTVKWHITGGPTELSGTTGFEELAYTWSNPHFARLQKDSDTVKDVLIFSGGYDPLEDAFPETFEDLNENGIWDDLNSNGEYDTGDEVFATTIGGTENYDYYNPHKDNMGRGIFVVDLSDGSILFKATYGDEDQDGDETEDVTTGIEQEYALMKYCFPANISVIPFSPYEIIMYAADIYGQIWKIKYNYFADMGHSYDDVNSTRWTVKRIFAANPGSDLATGDPDTFEAETHALNNADGGRKMFYSPDINYFGNDWSTNPVLYFGTGDRAHPRYAMISNRIYLVTDDDTLAYETDLLNVTCDELDDDADADGDGAIDDDDDRIRDAMYDILGNGSQYVRGLYKVLDKQGDCSEDALDHTGEMVLSQPTLFYKNVYFTSYQPIFDDPCNPAGNAFIYVLDHSFYTSGFNYDLSNDGTGEVRTITDTYRYISGSSIPSGVRVITRDGLAAGVFSAGGAVAGAGEGGSTSIPGPPGGIEPLLWWTY